MRIEQLTFTRFIAAIAIVVFHFGGDIFPFNINAVGYLVSQTNFGVSYFFVLSGFVMIIAYSNKDKVNFGEYLKKRIARIYPVFVLAILILFCYKLFTKTQINFKELLFNITLIQSWLPGWALSFNSPSWSLSVELFFYLLFPLLYNKFYKSQPYSKIFITILIVFIISQIVFHILYFSCSNNIKVNDFMNYFPLMHLNEFLVGNAAGLYFIKRKKERNYDFAIIVLFISMLIILKFKSGINYHDGMLAIIFIPIIILSASNKGIITKVFKHKTLAFLGEISYGIYILQFPVYNWVTYILNHFAIDNKTISFYTGLITLIFISSVSYLFFETPLRRKINNLNIKS